MNKDQLREWRVTTRLSGGFPAGGLPVSWRAGYALPRRWQTTLDAEHLPYIVELEFVADESGPSCRAIRVLARDAGKPISVRRIRDVPIAECIQRAVSAAVMRVEWRPGGEISYAPMGGDFDETMELARPRAASTSDEHLRDVADVYMKAPEKPTRAVEEAFGPISHSTAARWVGKARERGFIPKARGRTSARKGTK